jgi:hypothetical protein
MAITHPSGWHLLSTVFDEANQGQATPVRRTGIPPLPSYRVARSSLTLQNTNRLVVSPFALRIAGLDRADPPNYQPDSFPRDEFNRNVFRFTAEHLMPEIRVRCEVAGFESASVPIQWRLQVRHVLCRFQAMGNWRYRAASECLQDEWQGQSKRADFTIFSSTDDPMVQYSYNDRVGVLMGGHAILAVCAAPPGASAPLLDYVHLRIGGRNPTQDDALAWVDSALQGRNENLVHMVRSMYAHESNFRQFRDGPQSQAQLACGNVNPGDPCVVLFQWPRDPPHHPLVSFDFGVGISQYTRFPSQSISREIVWDWRRNCAKGINILFDKLRAKRHQGDTWRQWAWKGWKAYNGSGTAATNYANALLASAEGQQVSTNTVPNALDIDTLLAALPDALTHPPPPTWPTP